MFVKRMKSGLSCVSLSRGRNHVMTTAAMQVVGSNNLSGTPRSFPSSLLDLDLSDNVLFGRIQTNDGSLKDLDLRSNNLDMVFPDIPLPLVSEAARV